MSASVVTRGRALLTAGVLATCALQACKLQSAPPVERVQVRSAWARIADAGATSGAYLDLVNNDSVPLTLVSVTSDVSTNAEVHETMSQDGMSHMMARPTLTVAPGATLAMKPGGLHIMLIGVTRTLAAGDSISLALRFADSTTVSTRIPVVTP